VNRIKLTAVILTLVLILATAGCAAERKPTRTVTLSPDRQMLEIVLYDGDDAVEYLTITYEGGGLCVASSVRMEGSNE
jgi:hypothetical protein